ncbi:uncharacterized protein LOC143595590 [Bidens hawaiensis]|uniref:uncharacterized protein LOC143595590 n=1 Tax=Bidens hawaiensis TaxID=980011 RepID=UPI00404A8857
MGPDDWPDWLPGDWSVHIRKIDDRKVKCYVSADGHKCYSKPQVLDYLTRTKKSTPADKSQNMDDANIYLSVEPNATHTDEVTEPSVGAQPTKKLTPRTKRRKSISKDLSDNYIIGDASSTEPGSYKRHRGDNSWLPEGWIVEDRLRKNGTSSGMKYKIYTDPVSGHKFFSRPQVLKYLAKINGSADAQEHVQEAVFAEPISALPISSWQEKPAAEEPVNINTPTDGATEVKKTRKKTGKKTRSSRSSSDYEVVSRTPAQGLPEGWIKEVRKKTSGPSNRSDPYYLDPSSDYLFRSKKDALRYLETGDVKTCVSKPCRNAPPPPDQSTEPEATKEFTNGSAEELKTNESDVQNPKPIRSVSGGSYTTPDKGSFASLKEDTDWLPDGWLVDVRVKTSGSKYKIYKDPATGKHFYSKPQVLSYLGNPSGSSYSRKRKEPKSSVAPNSSPNSTPTDAARPKKSITKKSESENNEYKEVITTCAAEGLPSGWIKETRTKIYAFHTRNDPFYTDPVSGYIFRSKVDALRYLETGDVNLCAIRPKVKDKDGNEVFVYTDKVQKPATGDDVATETPEGNHTPDPKPADSSRRPSNRVTKNNSPASNSPAKSSKRQKGKDPETSEGNGAVEEKHETGVNLEKLPAEDSNLAFDIPEDANWADIDFAVKSLSDEVMFNGQPILGDFQEENGEVKEATPTKAN